MAPAAPGRTQPPGGDFWPACEFGGAVWFRTRPGTVGFKRRPEADRGRAYRRAVAVAGKRWSLRGTRGFSTSHLSRSRYDRRFHYPGLVLVSLPLRQLTWCGFAVAISAVAARVCICWVLAFLSGRLADFSYLGTAPVKSNTGSR